MRILSLGAGVQSTTLALMAAKGEIEPPEYAIFADTGWEPKSVYEHLHKLIVALPFLVHVVSNGNLRDALLSGGFTAAPFYTPTGMGARQCTYQYKLRPLQKEVRRLLGEPVRNKQADMLIGISLDEAQRMKPSRVKYINNVWPLIDLGMTRRDCLAWLEKAGWSSPKSSCLGCPFKNNRQWRELFDGDSKEWLDTVAMDHALREKGVEQYMHRSLKPLDKVDLSTWEERGQSDLFGMECEGMCGV
jgi:hypothetical protein